MWYGGGIKATQSIAIKPIKNQWPTDANWFQQL